MPFEVGTRKVNCTNEHQLLVIKYLLAGLQTDADILFEFPIQSDK